MVILTGMVLGGCGGRQIAPTKNVELNVPADLAKAFEVQELKPNMVTQARAVEAPGGEKKAGKNKKKKAIQSASTKTVKGPSIPDAGSAASGFVIPLRRPLVDPLRVGEKVWMDVTWLGTKAGEFVLEVQPFKLMNGRKVYDIKGSARTSDLFALIYRAEDWVQTYVDYEGWFPYKFVLHGDESKHIRNHLELFDHSAKKQYVHILDNRIEKNEVHEKKGYQDLTPFSQDSLSALYYARTFDLQVGKTVRFPMTTGGNQREVELTVLAKEEVQTKIGYLKALKTKVQTRFNGVLQQKGDAFIWFSDDERKYPVRFEAKVRIGWVAGIAKKIEPGIAENTRSESKLEEVKPMDEPTVSAVGGKDATSKGKPRTWFRQLLMQSKEDSNKK
ncbi:MAG: DUF3108 domain-containing protein [Bdellovibrionota bacterium]